MFTDLEKEAMDKAMKLLEQYDMDECRQLLMESFPESFINENNEFIAHKKSNQYIVLGNCQTPLDIECKVLEWFSRPACKMRPYQSERRNRLFHEFMLNGINNFLDTDFTEDEIADIYEYLGNCINHEKTIDFIESMYDFNILRKEEGK